VETNSDNLILKNIEERFNNLFLVSENTCLKGGFEEPFYKSADKVSNAEIRFTRNYESSALHEIAHWCVAGKDRRNRDDYGYWYVPDGRNDKQQEEFFRVEVFPQAYELCLSLSCKLDFTFSLDNLNGSMLLDSDFKENIFTKVEEILSIKPNSRLGMLMETYYLCFWKQRDAVMMNKYLKDAFYSIKDNL
jgi:elongation factor P hydroxylase